MRRKLVDATKAWRMRCTRGEMRCLRLRAAAVFAVLFDFDFADELDAFEEPLRVEGVATSPDCFPSACGERHRDPLVIPAAMNSMSFREDNTLLLISTAGN